MMAMIRHGASRVPYDAPAEEREDVMRAAVMRGKRLVVDEVPEPTAGPGQVLVETLACGICGSDLHTLQHPEQLVEAGRASGTPFLFDVERDLVMGHEFCARVIELGPGVTNVEPGDIVVSVPILLNPDGAVGIGYSNDYPGGYGERMVLTSALCLKVPAHLEPSHAALTEPMAVGLHAVAKSGIGPSESAVVLGCGPVGLAVIAALRMAGIETIVAADYSPVRREFARGMGAHEAVDPREEPAIKAWQRIDGSRGLVLFEAVGLPGMIDQAMRDAPRSSRIVIAGVCLESDTIWPAIGVTKELSLQFVLGYTGEEFARALQSIADGTVDAAPLITGEVGISDTPKAFDELASPGAHAKILVRPALG